MNYEIIEKIPTVREYQFLRASVGWRNYSETAVERSLQNSLYSLCAIDRNTVVGFGRLVGDGHLYFYLQDIMVLPEYQGHGIGYGITEKIDLYVKSIAPPGAFFGLMAAAGAAGLYEKFGFQPRSPEMPGMCKWIGQSVDFTDS
jgi:GNAT superfamily N-acetyltransferase